MLNNRIIPIRSWIACSAIARTGASPGLFHDRAAEQVRRSPGASRRIAAEHGTPAAAPGRMGATGNRRRRAAHRGRARHRPGDQEDRQARVGLGRTGRARRQHAQSEIHDQGQLSEGAEQSRVYLSLTVAGLPDSSGTSLQVCDGETLWDYQVVLDSAVLPQAEHQADPGTAQLTRARPEIQRPGHHPDGPGRPGDLARRAAQERSSSTRRKKTSSTARRSGDSTAPGEPARDWSARIASRRCPTAPCRLISRWTPRSTWARKMVGPTSSTLVGEARPQFYETRRLGPDGRPIGAKSSIEKIPPSRSS